MQKGCDCITLELTVLTVLTAWYLPHGKSFVQIHERVCGKPDCAKDDDISYGSCPDCGVIFFHQLPYRLKKDVLPRS